MYDKNKCLQSVIKLAIIYKSMTKNLKESWSSLFTNNIKKNRKIDFTAVLVELYSMIG